MNQGEFPLRVVRRAEAELDRRTFVKLIGATVLAAGAASCAGPTGEIVPYVTQPPEIVPGVPLHFATAMELDGYATGLIVESREGRPVKVEGNPAHPASLGAAGAFEQASVLQLYDPDRARDVKHGRAVGSWVECREAFRIGELQRVAGQDGAGLRFLLEPTASPLVLDLIARVRERLPRAQFHFYAPLTTAHGADGSRLAFGKAVQPLFDLQDADVVLTADANVFGEGPFHLRHARQFADGRRVRRAADSMNRQYAIEGMFTPTGIWADHRLAMRPSRVTGALAALLRELLGAATPDSAGSAPARAGLDRVASSDHADWIRAAGQDLLAHRGRSLVIVGDRQPALAHALGHAVNQAIGAVGQTVRYIEPVWQPDAESGIAALADAIRAQQVSALVILGGNPSYNAPADLGFSTLVRQVPLTLYSALYENETARDTVWFVPAAHYLESWGDARAIDGTTAIVQPLIAPLYDGRSTVDLLAYFAGDARLSHEVLREHWLAPGRMHGDVDAWRDALRRGVIPNTAAADRTVSMGWSGLADALDRHAAGAPNTLEVAFAPDPSVHDGRFSNNAWLQEMPDPVTKMTWDNAALMSAATARRIGVEASAFVQIESHGRSVRAPAFVVPGVADDLIVIPFGYGRQGAETVAKEVGVNAFAIWTAQGYHDPQAVSRPVVEFGAHPSHQFAITASHWSLEGRPIALEASLERFRGDPQFTADHTGPVPTLMAAAAVSGRQWGMAIDLTVCTGCSACVVACQAENNVPIVGKLGVQERREMHWLRIDRYLAGTAAHPRIITQPMLCQHCEDAPCEYVCPVEATVHSPDGLNEMVYNRCVGTRFCSNNCPYKVRRFNWYSYTGEKTEPEPMAMNPDVTVRDRGVMEKCSFCVQRIRRADIDAGVSGSPDAYGRLQTACQQACPTRAIVFGSISEPDAEVTRDARAHHSYRVLNDLGTRPRIAYLAKLRNPNPALGEDPA